MCLCSYRQRRTLSQRALSWPNGLPFRPHRRGHPRPLAESHRPRRPTTANRLGQIAPCGRTFRGHSPGAGPAPHDQLQQAPDAAGTASVPSRNQPKWLRPFSCWIVTPASRVCFSLSSSAQSVVQASPELLQLAAEILGPSSGSGRQALILADKEHFCRNSSRQCARRGFSTCSAQCRLTPIVSNAGAKFPPWNLPSTWPGYATALQPYHFQAEPEALYHEFVQRNGLRQRDFNYQGFLGTAKLSQSSRFDQGFPQRWHVEEFFKFNQALAGTAPERST